MLNDLLNLGLSTINAASATALQSQQRRDVRLSHPLAGYPRLLTALSTAERSGSLHAERRTLDVKLWSN